MKSKNGRTIRRSKVPQKQREQSKERITSKLGIRLRVNRSIQSEGTLGVLKEDWGIQEISAQRQKERLYRNPDLCVCVQYPELYAKEGNQRRGVILHSMKEAS